MESEIWSINRQLSVHKNNKKLLSSTYKKHYSCPSIELLGQCFQGSFPPISIAASISPSILDMISSSFSPISIFSSFDGPFLAPGNPNFARNHAIGCNFWIIFLISRRRRSRSNAMALPTRRNVIFLYHKFNTYHNK